MLVKFTRARGFDIIVTPAQQAEIAFVIDAELEK